MFKKLKHHQYGYLFITPFIIAFLIFSFYPILNTLLLSFTDRTLMSRTFNITWFRNFQLLFADKTFITAVTNTWELWLMNFIPQMAIAFLLAVWFTDTRLKIKGVGVWRMIFYMPNLMMASAVAALFFSLFSFYGPVNQFLVRSGFIPEAIDFIRRPAVMRGLVVFIQWWMWFGQTTILLMAAMTAISVSLYEAALVDGASTMQMFWHITLPLIKPVLIYVLVTSLVGGMQMFDIPYLLTDGRGSPNNSILTNTINMYMKFHSSKGHIGAASAVGIVVFLMTSVVALLIFFLLREKHDHPEKNKARSS
ncbi:MAG: sugar ABC transporter permease [Anaerolineaceae bacterium]|jgi:multiple sugar transport system permease protein|nr:sugar ABC transporter permease [Anaerolineaceae bacterium]MDD4042877.1 sugar ABC transporter permease [Anaerolineaceae bacterium]MDD4577131.1 sugar ABC transporter permease [Anaerolineaceae bacterium]